MAKTLKSNERVSIAADPAADCETAILTVLNAVGAVTTERDDAQTALTQAEVKLGDTKLDKLCELADISAQHADWTVDIIKLASINAANRAYGSNAKDDNHPAQWLSQVRLAMHPFVRANFRAMADMTREEYKNPSDELKAWKPRAYGATLALAKIASAKIKPDGKTDPAKQGRVITSAATLEKWAEEHPAKKTNARTTTTQSAPSPVAPNIAAIRAAIAELAKAQPRAAEHWNAIDEELALAEATLREPVPTPAAEPVAGAATLDAAMMEQFQRFQQFMQLKTK